MVRPLITVDPTVVRALIAGVYLQPDAVPTRIGAITLRPHQREAIVRLRRALAELGGALLADDVGLGKTYVASALVREATRALVVVPASLREMWLAALHSADARAEVVSYTTLSRAGGPGGAFDLLVLDEAHHARTPTTRRYERLAELATGARVLLLSATPIHNSRAELAALLALFLGARASRLSDRELARYVVRREHRDVAGAVELPEIDAPAWLSVGDDEPLLSAILALPPPLPSSDGGDGGALLLWTLVRLWASSRGALEGALRRRLARAAALAAALESGRYPTGRELTSWVCGDEAVQLAFPELLAPCLAELGPLRDAVSRHEGAVRALLERVRRSTGVDAARADRLRELRSRHAGEKIVAFTQFGDTVRSLFRELRTARGVAGLTARGAMVAGGVLSRREAIERFAPRASGVAPPREIERVDLLLTTDLLSEGVNLHDASVVVHLDLPWTPARLEQRVGRSRRMGARHERTWVYALAPPATAESLLRVEERLREKLRAAGSAIGALGTILPSLTTVGTSVEPSPTRQQELIRQALTRWTAESPIGVPMESGAVSVAAVRATASGYLAVAATNEGEPLLVGALNDGAASDDPLLLLQLVEWASGEGTAVDAAAVGRSLEAVERWLAFRAADRASGVAFATPASVRSQALRRISAITARAPHHRRPVLASLAEEARSAVTAPYGVGAERALQELISVPLPDEAWLHAIGAFGASHRGGVRDHRGGASPHEVIAILIFGARG